MRHYIIIFLLSAVIQTSANTVQYDTMPDTRKLGIALDYFTGGKYHEALIMFLKLDKRYKLNPRFKAYIGLCYYYEWDYEQACKYLDNALPSLTIYAPAERSIYYNAAAESHFELKEYRLAIPVYEMGLLTCRQSEKANIFYKLGFCYMLIGKTDIAADNFKSALAYYKTYPDANSKAHITQLKNMIRGLETNNTTTGS